MVIHIPRVANGLRVFGREFGQEGDVVFGEAHFLHGGDLQILGQAVDGFDGLLRGLPHAEPADVFPKGLGDARELLRFPHVVVLHDRAEQPRGERAVGHIPHAARGLTHGVGRARALRAVGQPTQHGGHAHLVARLHVVALGKGDAQVLAHVFHGQEGNRVGECLGVGHRVALDGVGQRVHARGRGDGRGQPHGEQGVDERDVRADVGRAPHVELDLPLGVRDHGPEGDLAARARGGGHRDQGRNAAGDGVGVGPLVVPDRTAVGDHHADGLGRVQGTAAAKADEAVAAAFLVERGPFVHQRDGRVRDDAVEEDDVHVAPAQHLEGFVHQARLDQALVSDEQRAFHAQGLDLVGQVLERAQPVFDGRGKLVGSICLECHGSLLGIG